MSMVRLLRAASCLLCLALTACGPGPSSMDAGTGGLITATMSNQTGANVETVTYSTQDTGGSWGVTKIAEGESVIASSSLITTPHYPGLYIYFVGKPVAGASYTLVTSAYGVAGTGSLQYYEGALDPGTISKLWFSTGGTFRIDTVVGKKVTFTFADVPMGVPSPNTSASTGTFTLTGTGRIERFIGL